MSSNNNLKYTVTHVYYETDESEDERNTRPELDDGDYDPTKTAAFNSIIKRKNKRTNKRKNNRPGLICQ